MGTNAPFWIKIDPSAWFSSILDKNLAAKLLDLRRSAGSNPDGTQNFSKFFCFFLKTFFNAFFIISYAQKHIYLAKYIVIGEKVRFGPIVHCMSPFSTMPVPHRRAVCLRHDIKIGFLSYFDLTEKFSPSACWRKRSFFFKAKEDNKIVGR